MAVHQGWPSKFLGLALMTPLKARWQHGTVARSVVVVDDHAGFRAQAAQLLEAAGYEVVGSCPDGRSALAAISKLHPDVVLLDVQLPDTDGFRLITQLDAGCEGPAIVLISSREAVDYGARVGRSGAAGFITKAELSAQTLAKVVGR